MSWNDASADTGFGGGGRSNGDEWGTWTGDGGNAGQWDAPAGGVDDFSGHNGAGADERPRGACYNCGEEGHNKADCPKPRVLRCRHCGEEGHAVRNCPDPNAPAQEEFTGECRSCGQQGHRSADCPDRPPMKCRNCEEEGHHAGDCKNPRKVDRSLVADVAADVAWEKIMTGAKERDMDTVKEGIAEYVKAQPELTYSDLHMAFKAQDLGVYVMAIEKPQLVGALTNMDLQGNLGKKYTVSLRFSDKPARAREAEYFPKTAEENLERLKDAGEPVNRGQSKCINCNEYGHTSRFCPTEAVEKERVVVKCFNCGEEGHRVRDCPKPRHDKFACKNCGQPGHKASECTEPPNMDNVECRKCGETGHFSRDCPQGGGGSGACHNCGQEGHRAKDCTEEKKIICRNCDAEGHLSRECTKPRDYSRVKCSNCGEMGHTKVRCKQPAADADADAAPTGGNFGNPGDGATNDNFGASDPTDGGSKNTGPGSDACWTTGADMNTPAYWNSGDIGGGASGW